MTDPHPHLRRTAHRHLHEPPSADHAFYQHLADHLHWHGYAMIKLQPRTVAILDQLIDRATDFFARPGEEKQAHALPSCVEGYRAIGPEYSLTPERPDLTESFSYWHRNRHRPELPEWQQTCPLHPMMQQTETEVSGIVAELFRQLAAKWQPDAPEIAFRKASYLQVNYYEPRNHQRDLLQDPHEDAHLLTLLRAAEPGLEIEVNGRYQPVELAADEMLVMPGSLLSLMTGHLISPLFHQVRNSRRAQPRYSFMYFINPEIDQDLKPWIVNDSNAGIDIIERASNAPKQFGLPTLVDGAKGKG